MKFILTVVLGFIFGAILIKAEAFHWYRIQEMFHFQSFHMYGLLGSAILTGAISVWGLRKIKPKTIDGKVINLTQKKRRPAGNIIGGLFFGAGWALTGACTAPLIIIAGWKWEVGAIGLLGALLGTIFYALVQTKLPR